MGKTRKGLHYKPQDKFYEEAKAKGFVARSALKLEEIDLRWKIFKKGQRVLDLGCAPGSWLQYASGRVGKKGKLLGIDIEEVRVSLPNTQTEVMSLYDLSAEAEPLASWLEESSFDVLQSDAMVKTIGISDSDVARSIALVESSLALAESRHENGNSVLRYGGTFIAKVFEGPGFTEFYTDFKKKFSKQYVAKPKAIRKGSREVYIVGIGYKPHKRRQID